MEASWLKLNLGQTEVQPVGWGKQLDNMVRMIALLLTEGMFPPFVYPPSLGVVWSLQLLLDGYMAAVSMKALYHLCVARRL